MREKCLITFQYSFFPAGSKIRIDWVHGKSLVNGDGTEPEIKDWNAERGILMEDAWLINYTFQGNSAHAQYTSGIHFEYSEALREEVFEGWWEEIIELIVDNHPKMMCEAEPFAPIPEFDKTKPYSGHVVTLWDWWDYSYGGSLEEPPDYSSEWELLGVLDLWNAPVIKAEKKSILDLKDKAQVELGQCSCGYCQYLKGNNVGICQ